MSGLFGSTQQKPSLLFGNTAQPQQQTGGLFGGQQQQPQQTGGGLFGGQQQQQQTGGLFGGQQQQQQQQQQKPTLSLFGLSQQNAGTGAGGGGIFGSSQQQPQQQPQQQASGLFGSTQQKPTLSLFPPAAQPSAGGGLFASQQQPQQQQPQQQPQGLFGALGAGNQQQQQPGQSLFGGLGAGNQQQQQPQGLFASFGASAQNQQQPQHPQQQPLNMSFLGSVNNSSVWQPGPNILPREKSVPEQMQVMYEKWDPSSPACAFQHYFYNQVPEESAPYYAPGPGEDEKKWEEALKERPSPGSIPVLARGPLAVGRRLETQATWVRGIQTRLHELNDILSKRMQVHDLEYSVRAQEARRKHVALSRRCLSLATKVQVLRNRGYALDSTEEQLRVKLVQLEKVAFDPMLSGRQEEVWARMSVVRQRAQMLQSETEKLGKQVNTSTEELLDDEQMKRIERILSNYEAQLVQLKKERESAEKDLLDWQAATGASTALHT